MKLCGYKRDIEMPMAYDGYYLSFGNEKYSNFYNSSYETDNSKFNIIIDENVYSPHWVYYNKPEAYREAGITPDELIKMLPQYKSLGILTDEAFKALEEKIYAYAESCIQ